MNKTRLNVKKEVVKVELATVIGKEIKAADLIASIEDKGGIKSIIFLDAQIERYRLIQLDSRGFVMRK